MPDAAELEARLDRVRTAMRERGLGGCLVWARSFYDRPGPIAYLIGFLPPFPSSADAPGVVGLGQSALIVPTDGPALLLLDAISRPPTGVPAQVIRTGDMVTEVAARLRTLGATRTPWGLGGEDIVPHRVMRLLGEAIAGIDLVPVDDALMTLRRRKSTAEIEGMRRAAQVARRGFEAAVAALRVGAAEREVSAAGVAACVREGADFIRYFRVHAGLASAAGSRWPPATDARIGDGDLVTMDLIGAVDGYGFDLLRTALVGHAPDEARALAHDAYAVCRQACASIRPGGTVEALVATIRTAAAATSSAPYLGGFFGHGIGLETLEWPYLMPGQTGTFEAGEVLCVEPGMFRTGLGGACLEDEVVVREGGAQLLSDFFQEPIVVP